MVSKFSMKTTWLSSTLLYQITNLNIVLLKSPILPAVHFPVLICISLLTEEFNLFYRAFKKSQKIRMITLDLKIFFIYFNNQWIRISVTVCGSAWSCRDLSDGRVVIMQNVNRCSRSTFLVRSLRNITGTYVCC